MSETSPSNSAERGLWADFFRVETEKGRTFDPLEYLIKLRSSTLQSYKGQTWEDYYEEMPERIGRDLISIIKQHSEQLIEYDDLDVMVTSTIRVAESLRVASSREDQDPGTKNEVLSSLFWACKGIPGKQQCHMIFNEHADLFSEESQYYMQQFLDI